MAAPHCSARRLLPIVVLAWCFSVPAPAAEPVLSPAQTAFLNAEQRRIDERFFAEVANIAGVSVARVRAAMPDERRITVVSSRLISALEMELGAPLDGERKAAIHAADARRKKARAAALRAAEQR